MGRLFYLIGFMAFGLQSQVVAQIQRFYKGVVPFDETRTTFISSSWDKHGNSYHPCFQGELLNRGSIYRLDRSGNLKWEKLLVPGNSANETYLTSSDIKSDDSLLVLGNFDGSAYFNQVPITGNGKSGLILVIDSSGNYLKSNVVTTTSRPAGFSAARFGKKGDYYVLGSFGANVIFNGDTIQSADSSNKFICRLDANLSKTWLQVIHSPNNVSLFDLGVDSQNNVIFSGIFRDTVYFPDTILYTPLGKQQAFLVKMNPQGQIVWLQQIAAETAYRAKVDGEGNTYVAGAFGPGPLVADTLQKPHQAGFSNFYILKFNPSGSALWASTLLVAEPGFGFVQSLSIDEANHRLLIGGQYGLGNLTFGSATYPSWVFSNYIGYLGFLDSETGQPGWSTYFGNQDSHIDGVQAHIDSAGKIRVSHCWYADHLKMGCQTFTTQTLCPYWLKFGVCNTEIDTGQVTPVSCFGQQDGAIHTAAHSTEGQVDYTWTGGISGPNRSNLGPGNYRLIVGDATCCRDTAVFRITQPVQIPLPLISGTDSIWTQTQSGYRASPLDTGYQISWDVANGQILNGQGSDSITVLWNQVGVGTVQLLFTNGVNCLKDTVLNVAILTETNKVNKKSGYSLYPNPGTNAGFLELGSNQGKVEISVHSLTGQTVFQNTATDVQIVPLVVNGPPGIYLVQVKDENGVETVLKWVKL